MTDPVEHPLCLSDSGSPRLGDELKRRRLELGIELREISESTCIGIRFLRAIENDDFSLLPGGLFTRSFIRSYARHVGMDEGHALELYFLQHDPGRGESPDSTGRVVQSSSLPSRWANVIITLAVLTVLAIAGIAGLHYWQRSSSRESVTERPVPNRLRGVGAKERNLTRPAEAESFSSPAPLVNPNRGHDNPSLSEPSVRRPQTKGVEKPSHRQPKKDPASLNPDATQTTTPPPTASESEPPPDLALDCHLASQREAQWVG